ncbi:MAG TPA: N-acetylmuramoyl-L-alanine amidase [Gemmatimonadales bacterium]|nr:N-acetylmuramoyl-L-alanine amidase [Gemmatimonadales bacterium]
MYPAPGAVVDAADSTYLLGTTGAGDAALTINGASVKVWPNGAWIAWVSLPADSIPRFELRASTPRDTTSLVYELRRAPRFIPPPATVWIDSTSLTPRGRVWVHAGEYLTLTARAAPGARLHLRLPNGAIVPLAPDPVRADAPEAVRAFGWDTLKLETPVRTDRYRGMLRGCTLGSDPGPVLPVRPSAAEASWQRAALFAVRGADTASVEWPLQIALLDTFPTIAALDDDPERLGGGDGITAGRSAIGATYAWFFPAGTRVQVSGRMNDELRIRLADGVEAWVAAAEAQPLPGGTPVPRARAGPLTLTPARDRVLARIPLGERVPFLVQEGDRRLALYLYGADGDIDWIRYGPAMSDSLVRRVTWHHEAGNVLRLDFELTRPVWGYRARWSEQDLILEIRRPPVIDGGNPLRGRIIAVDPGHPPAGATGPTGLRESEANLAVATMLAGLLKDAGARPTLTRTADVPVDHGSRVPMADSMGAELFVSIHQNALPDGLDPFPNSGTSVFYNQPRSLPLARAIQRRLVAVFGARDLGTARADLAVTRGSWTPAVLVEGLHIIMPQHEAALRTRTGQEMYARGVLEGIRDFLSEIRDKRQETK